MTVTARRFTIAGTAAAVFAALLCAVYLHAQDNLRYATPGISAKSATPGISSKPEKDAASDSSNDSASAVESSLTASEVQEKVSETIEGIKTGEISTAKHAATFDNFLQETFCRISDCWTLCRQEIALARESARTEAVQTAEDIYQKGKDAVTEQGGKSIIPDILPSFASPEGQDSEDDKDKSFIPKFLPAFAKEGQDDEDDSGKNAARKLLPAYLSNEKQIREGDSDNAADSTLLPTGDAEEKRDIPSEN